MSNGLLTQVYSFAINIPANMLGLFVKKLVVVIYCLTGRVDLGVEIKNVTALTHVLILT